MLKLKSILVALSCLGVFTVAAQATEWAKSDIPSDPAATFGVLPNGMRYAVMHNATPSGSVSVRLRIDAGSLQETDAQRGLAHFLEHMAFRGSAHVADGEINKSLERMGLRFGADTNASTDQDQTIYQFDLPKSDDKTVDTVIGYTREIASNLTLDPAAAKTEAGVVLQELKLRDSPGARAVQSELDFMLRDAHATALPSGNPDVIAKAPVDEIRSFYQAYYRPERTTLVIVGDIDPARIVAKIKDDFADWKGVGPAGSDPHLQIPMARSAEAKAYVEAGSRPRLSLLWVTPPEPKPDDLAQEKSDLVDSLALQILNRRLREAAAGTSPPFTSASAGREQMLQAARLTTMSITYEPDQWRSALAAADNIRLGTLQSGVSQAEVDQARDELHAAFQSINAGAATRPSRRIMADILTNLSANDVFTSPSRDVAAADAYMKGLTASEVTAALRRIFGDSTPLIFEVSAKPVEGGEPALRQALLDIEKAPLTPLAEAKALAVVKDWPYADFGKPGRVTETKQVNDLGFTTVHFANGVKLTVRPSKLRANQVLVAVKVGGGRLDLPKDKATVAWAAGAILAGGLQAMPYSDMQRLLAAKTVHTGFGVGENGFIFTGNTSPDDMNTQLQVIAAYLQAPGFRPEGMEQTKSRYAAQLRQSDTSPGAILRLKAPELLHDGDKRWATPSPQEVEDAHIDDLKALLTPVFQNGALDVTIVGDIPTDKAVAAVAATFGALPSRTKARSAVTSQNDTHLPGDKVTPIDLSHSGQSGSQVIASVVWPTHGRIPDIQDDATLQLMSDILQERLFDKLRGAGVAYEAQAGASSSKVFDYGYIQALAQLSPEKTPEFYDALNEISADLKAGKITSDELDRARNPALQEFQKSQETNEYWLSTLDDAQENPKVLDMPRKYEAALRKVDISDIAAAAKKYLAEPRMIRLTSSS